MLSSRTLRKAGESKFQLGIAVNLVLVAVGLPLGWNFIVRRKNTEAALERAKAAPVEHPEPSAAPLPAGLPQPALETAQQREEREKQEKLIVELIVNERRAERGLPPYNFHAHKMRSAGGGQEQQSIIEQALKAAPSVVAEAERLTASAQAAEEAELAAALQAAKLALEQGKDAATAAESSMKDALAAGTSNSSSSVASGAGELVVNTASGRTYVKAPAAAAAAPNR